MTNDDKDNKQAGYPEREIAILEYESLMAESTSRVEIRHQIILSTLAFAGVFSAVGLQTPYAAFLYPPFALFLMASWWHNEQRIRQIGEYLRDFLTTPRGVLGLGWGAYLSEHKTNTQILGIPVVVAAPAGIYVFTELLALIIGITTSPWGVASFIGASIAVLVLVATNMMIWSVHKKTRQI